MVCMCGKMCGVHVCKEICVVCICVKRYVWCACVCRDMCGVVSFSVLSTLTSAGQWRLLG